MRSIVNRRLTRNEKHSLTVKVRLTSIRHAAGKFLFMHPLSLPTDPRSRRRSDRGLQGEAMSNFIIKEAKTGSYFKNFYGPNEVLLTPIRSSAAPISDMQAARNVRDTLLAPCFAGADWQIVEA